MATSVSLFFFVFFLFDLLAQLLSPKLSLSKQAAKWHTGNDVIAI